MCNLYKMTATVDEVRRLFGPFRGDTANLPPFNEIYPGYPAPVLLRQGDGSLALEMMKWGFPGPPAAGGRQVTTGATRATALVKAVSRLCGVYSACWAGVRLSGKPSRA